MMVVARSQSWVRAARIFHVSDEEGKEHNSVETPDQRSQIAFGLNLLSIDFDFSLKFLYATLLDKHACYSNGKR